MKHSKYMNYFTFKDYEPECEELFWHSEPPFGRDYHAYTNIPGVILLRDETLSPENVNSICKLYAAMIPFNSYKLSWNGAEYYKEFNGKSELILTIGTKAYLKERGIEVGDPYSDYYKDWEKCWESFDEDDEE